MNEQADFPALQRKALGLSRKGGVGVDALLARQLGGVLEHLVLGSGGSHPFAHAISPDNRSADGHSVAPQILKEIRKALFSLLRLQYGGHTPKDSNGIAVGAEAERIRIARLTIEQTDKLIACKCNRAPGTRAILDIIIGTIRGLPMAQIRASAGEDNVGD